VTYATRPEGYHEEPDRIKRETRCLPCQDDGNSHTCHHRWGSELVEVDRGCWSIVCEVCGVDRMSHDMRYAP
jgi:hypothetical protein